LFSKIEVKMDENTTYFTLIAVCSKNPLFVTDGKILYLKYKPICFTEKDMKNVEMAKLWSKNELIKTNFNDALDAFGVEELARTVSSFWLASRVNNASIHCFRTEFELTEDDCDSLVNSANFDDYMKKKLIESRVG
jgi:hypothetical protein